MFCFATQKPNFCSRSKVAFVLGKTNYLSYTFLITPVCLLWPLHIQKLIWASTYQAPGSPVLPKFTAGPRLGVHSLLVGEEKRQPKPSGSGTAQATFSPQAPSPAGDDQAGVGFSLPRGRPPPARSLPPPAGGAAGKRLSRGNPRPRRRQAGPGRAGADALTTAAQPPLNGGGGGQAGLRARLLIGQPARPSRARRRGGGAAAAHDWWCCGRGGGAAGGRSGWLRRAVAGARE